MGTIRVVLADEQTLVRQMLAESLSRTEGFEVVAEVGSGAEAVEACRKYRPQVLVLELGLSDLPGVEVTRQVQRLVGETAVLVLTAIEDEVPFFESLAAGAQGYLLKDSTKDELISAIKNVASGRAVLHPRVTPTLLREFQRTRVGRVEVQYEESLKKLTPREQEVLRLIGRGLSNREIGEQLVISEKTAKTHVANLLRRIGVKDRVAAAIFAVKSGLCE